MDVVNCILGFVLCPPNSVAFHMRWKASWHGLSKIQIILLRFLCITFYFSQNQVVDKKGVIEAENLGFFLKALPHFYWPKCTRTLKGQVCVHSFLKQARLCAPNWGELRLDQGPWCSPERKPSCLSTGLCQGSAKRYFPAVAPKCQNSLSWIYSSTWLYLRAKQICHLWSGLCIWSTH